VEEWPLTLNRMQKLTFRQSDEQGLHLLCLGAHCDDIEIGCGATLLRLFGEQKIASVQWVVFTSTPERQREALNSAGMFLEGVTGSDVEVHNLRDGFLPVVWAEVKEMFEQIKQKANPDIIFTHYRNDLHQDHRLISELTWNTFRSHLILEYEIPKYDGDLYQPNFFVPIDRKTADRKKDILLTSFKSQLGKHWFDDVLLTSLMRIRGVESASETGLAEAFHARKICI
jgi:LmbE family N-acetylglucosaminyl deacetylase